MARLIQSNTQRQTAATLRLHRDDTSFFMDEQRLAMALTGVHRPEVCWSWSTEDPETGVAASASETSSKVAATGLLSGALAKTGSVEEGGGRASKSLSGAENRRGSMIFSDGGGRASFFSDGLFSEASKSLRGPEMMCTLRSSVTEQMDRHLPRHAYLCSLPMFAVRYIGIEGPIGNVLSRSIFTTSSSRALLLAVDTLSGLFFVTMFFTVTGGAQAKKQEALDCELKNFWEVIGRLIAIAVASCIIGGIPGAFFASLQTRGPKVCNSPEERRRQLKVWRCQDVTLWVCGLAYMAFAINFIVLFFANVDTGNVMEWVISAGIGLLQDHLLLPLSTVILHSLLTMLLVAIVARGQGVKKHELVRKYRLEKPGPGPKDGNEEDKKEKEDGAAPAPARGSGGGDLQQEMGAEDEEMGVEDEKVARAMQAALDVCSSDACSTTSSSHTTDVVFSASQSPLRGVGIGTRGLAEEWESDDTERGEAPQEQYAEVAPWTPPFQHPPPGLRLAPINVIPGAVDSNEASPWCRPRVEAWTGCGEP